MISHLVAARVLSGPAAIAGVLSAQLAGAQLVATATLSSLPIEGSASAVLAPASLSAVGQVRLAASLAAALDGAVAASTGRLSIKGSAAAVADDATAAGVGRLSIGAVLSQSLQPASIVSAGLLVTVEVKAFLARQARSQAKASEMPPGSASANVGAIDAASRAVRAASVSPMVSASGSPVGAASASTVIGPQSRSIRLS